MDEEFLKDLALVIERTGVERYRFLCLEHPNLRVRATYRRWVSEQIRGTARSKAGGGMVSQSLSKRRARRGDCGGCGGKVKSN